MDDDDASRRFKEMPLDEFRRRVDLAIAYLRDMRSGFAATGGMILEEMDRKALPAFDKEQAEAAFQNIIEMLPLVKPRPPGEKPKRQPISQKQTDATEKALEAMLKMDRDEFDETMKESGLTFTYDDLLGLQEEGEKLRLLGLVQQETVALARDLEKLEDALADRAQGLLTAALQKGMLGGPKGGSGKAN